MIIAIIDDHPMVRLGLSAAITTSLDDVIAYDYGSPKEFIDGYDKDSIDLILVDYHIPTTIPEQNYTDLAKAMPDAKIMFFSSDESDMVIARVSEMGADGFVDKSAKTNLLIAAISVVLAGGEYYPKHIMVQENELDGLTRRQKQIAKLLVKGLSNKEISTELFITESTVKHHVSGLYDSLGLSGRKDAIAWLIKKLP